MDEQIRVGLIGAGIDRGRGTNAHLPWSRQAHAPAIAALRQYRLEAVATTKAETARAAAEFFGAPLGFADSRQLIEHPDVDLVVISVRAPFHYDLARAAIEAGKDVFCEWPLALSADQADDLTDRAERRGVRHLVGLQARAAPTFNYVRDIVAAGEIGSLLSVNVSFAAPTWGGVVEAPVAYLHDKANGATLLSIYGGHALDVLCHMFGEVDLRAATITRRFEAVHILETGEVRPKTSPDQVLVQGLFPSGAPLSLHLQGGVRGLAGVRVEIRGSEGDLLVTTNGIIEASPLTLRGGRNVHDPSVAVEANRGRELPVMTVPDSYRHVPASLGEGPALNVGELYARFANAAQTPDPALPDFRLAARRHHQLETIEALAEAGALGLAPAA